MTEENKVLQKTPEAGIQQINLAYDKVQDRFLFRVGLSDQTEVALWLTYRFSKELWSALNKEAHLPVSEAFNSLEVTEAVEQFQQEFEAIEALEKLDFATEYQPRENLRNDSLLLAVGFTLTEDVKHLDIECLEGVTVNINLTPELILAICNMLLLAAKEAGWELKTVIPAFVMDEASASKALH